jgi:hypothetical protein
MQTALTVFINRPDEISDRTAVPPSSRAVPADILDSSTISGLLLSGKCQLLQVAQDIVGVESPSGLPFHVMTTRDNLSASTQ